ncbi:MAG: C_GCAxxG_C_C family protein [Candidatus Heimdallarchaeota archaeon]|nr:C_GCAxxG_C_C family protein [Candidatus Heimdallarchaeota archaeon]MCK5047962.1 C_GCAxxG_C_C family protein [Candidatus Heimdallarchaeota archaeon]
MSNYLDLANQVKEKLLSYQNCAITVACVLLDYNDFPQASATLLKSLVPFVGYAPEEKLMCGSAIGGLAALSFILSEKGLSTDDIIGNVVGFKRSFNEDFNTLVCAEILEPHLQEDGTYPLSAERIETCNKTVERAAIIAQQIIDLI